MTEKISYTFNGLAIDAGMLSLRIQLNCHLTVASNMLDLSFQYGPFCGVLDQITITGVAKRFKGPQ